MPDLIALVASSELKVVVPCTTTCKNSLIVRTDVATNERVKWHCWRKGNFVFLRFPSHVGHNTKNDAVLSLVGVLRLFDFSFSAKEYSF